MKNVLLIFADQMHKYALQAVSPFVHTPNLDRLCKKGTRFEYCYSNNPVCGPFRGVMLSGQQSSFCGVKNNGDPLPTDRPMLADIFNQAGYETAFIGKWHLGGNGNNPIPKQIRGGFQHFFGYQCYNGFWKDVCFYDEEDREHRFDEHRETVCTRYAIDYMKKMHGTGKPFFEVVGYQAPHYPEQPSPEFEALYAGKRIPTPPDFVDVDPYTPTFSPFSPRPFENCPDYQRYGGNMQEYLRLYYAMVGEIDAGVGRLLDTLDELSIAENTLVLFTADHGDMQGSRGLLNKCLPYERSCGIPLIISGPGLIEGGVVETPVSAVDFYPTLMTQCGLGEKPSHLQGNDISPLLMGEPYQFKTVFAEDFSGRQFAAPDGAYHIWKMARDERYKLIVTWDDKKPVMLFDMQEDPYEMNNLIGRLTEVESHLYNEIIKEFEGAPGK